MAMAWDTASCTFVLGAYQSNAAYSAGVYRLFIKSNEAYKNREKGRAMRRLGEMFRDVNVINRFLLESAGTNNKDMFKMAIALHLGNALPTSSDASVSNMYNLKDFETSL